MLIDFEVAVAAGTKEILTRKEAQHSVRVRIAKLGDLEAEEDTGPVPTL